ncbi:hypothetical protein H8K20_03300 [Neobittarella massiliensis]|uniref:Uncharacterized protein n=1 Tax=Neobittarella massiliensis (ex Bilen et al. 2018) TaxID=2041842 RepID=A0A8J6IPB1_9FIRM|nr:hypothetical protein [Neobittarella massiliensis]MBC3515423.1 hypothetical protein [Neobittarella massiliensis]
MTAKKRLLKLGALLAALLLIAAIAGVAASFLGDPVSAAIAQKGIDRYLRQQYPHSQLQVKKPVYNFKLGRYTVQVQDPGHVDAHFSVEWKPHFLGGSVCYDSYDTSVTALHNTALRLEESFGSYLQPHLAQIEGLKQVDSRVEFTATAYEDLSPYLQLDMPFDPRQQLPLQLQLFVDLGDMSCQQLAALFTQVHQRCLDAGVAVQCYHLSSFAENGPTIRVENLRPADIESGQLVALLQNALQNPDPIGQKPKEEVTDEEYRQYRDRLHVSVS